MTFRARHTRYNRLIRLICKKAPPRPEFYRRAAKMLEHGIARAGYIEAPRDPDMAYEFLKTEWRKVQRYGVDSAVVVTTAPP